MTIKIKKQNLVRIISFTLAIIAALIGCIVNKNMKIKRLGSKINNAYAKSLSELGGNLDSITKNLEKIIYSNTASQFNSISNDILTESLTAKNSLSALPGSSENELKTINKFLSQVGDYTSYLSKKVIENQEITEKERKNLESLLKVGKALNQSVGDISNNYSDIDSWADEIESKTESIKTNDGFTKDMTEIEESLSDYPTLIYDGPFSDHIKTAVPEVTKNESEIFKSEAKQKIADMFGIEFEKIKDGNDENSSLPSYGFYTDDTTVSVSKKGGHIVFFRKYRTVKRQKVSEEEAVKTARDYLKKHSDEEFIESYYFTDEGVCTVNFAYKNGATVCYTDLIKVGVAIDNGEIMFVEARGYLMNHKKRTINTPKYSAEQAQAVISKSLTVNSVKQALIPSASNREIHCYEFNCTGKNKEKLLIYVNSNTLNEEKIFTVLSTDGGTLVE